MRHLSIVLTHRPRLRSKRLAWFVSAALAGGTVNAPVAAQSFPPVVNLGGLSTSDGSVFGGVAPSDYAGYSVSAAGDINGDGIADLAVGASQADPSGTTNAGTTFVIFGNQDGPTGRDLDSVNGINGFALTGSGNSDFSGSSVAAAGDFIGDGVDDLMIGAPLAGPSQAGPAYVVVGGGGPFPATRQLAGLNGTTGSTLNGAVSQEFAGFAVNGGGDDLNPIRAGMAQTPEQSDYTSILQRILERDPKIGARDPHAIERLPEDLQAAIGKLLPFADQQPADPERAIPYEIGDYLELVDASGRAVVEGKRGSIPENLPPILGRLDINTEHYIRFVSRSDKNRFGNFIGPLQTMRELANRFGKTFLKGEAAAPEVAEAA